MATGRAMVRIGGRPEALKSHGRNWTFVHAAARQGSLPNSEEAVAVPVDHRVADEDRGDRAERQERAERHGGLAAARRADAGDDDAADEDAGDERDEDRRGHGLGGGTTHAPAQL